ncbi:hypothetical protein H5V45_04345 [Nocardioides sp. KIGAM211]|uniref:Uncharacterized protein n=1 Tax=Nocardioides luti TaxID=2761101 RepID=A0A7X0V9D6_9ACTN|nr:hypothetical protein [Nocardioides luti]MBB6626549.1 hypothetical protein [Nocardioides luti]
MTTGPVRETRRHEFPPLVLVAVLVVAANVLVLWVLTAVFARVGEAVWGHRALGIAGFALACVVLVGLDRRVDAYARARSAFEDDD